MAIKTTDLSEWKAQIDSERKAREQRIAAIDARWAALSDAEKDDLMKELASRAGLLSEPAR